MLDRDHALTEEGIKQAEALNIKWRFEGSNDVAQQQQAVKTPKPKESPTAASGGGGIISFIDPEEEANFATAGVCAPCGGLCMFEEMCCYPPPLSPICRSTG